MRSSWSSEGRPAYGANEIDRGCPLATAVARLLWHVGGTGGEDDRGSEVTAIVTSSPEGEVNRPGFSGGFAVPLVSWSPMSGFSCHGGGVLELYRGEHAQRAVASGAVVEDLQVLKDRVGQLHPSLPAAPVQQLDLHP